MVLRMENFTLDKEERRQKTPASYATSLVVSKQWIHKIMKFMFSVKYY